MKLSRLLRHRLALVSGLALIGCIAILMTEAVLTVGNENSAAGHLLDLTARIDALAQADPAQFDRQLAEIVERVNAGTFRHTVVTIRQADGKWLSSAQAPPLSLPGRLVSAIVGVPAEHPPLVRTLGRAGHTVIFEIETESASELNEAGTHLMLTLAIVAAFAALLYAGTQLTLARALTPLKAAIRQLGALAAGRYDARVDASDVDEIQEINAALLALSDALASLDKSRQMLSAKLISTQEDERAHLSRELHDELGQKIASIRMNVGFLEKTLKADDSAKLALTDIRAATKAIDGDIRAMIRRLRASHALMTASNADFRQLLLELIDGWQSAPGQPTRFTHQITLTATDLPENVKLILFRITQEALTNIAKHAHATEVSIAINQTSNDVCWRVADNGVGAAAEISALLRQGNGLSGLKERLWSVGGELTITAPVTGTGVVLTARIPLTN